MAKLIAAREAQLIYTNLADAPRADKKISSGERFACNLIFYFLIKILVRACACMVTWCKLYFKSIESCRQL